MENGTMRAILPSNGQLLSLSRQVDNLTSPYSGVWVEKLTFVPDNQEEALDILGLSVGQGRPALPSPSSIIANIDSYPAFTLHNVELGSMASFSFRLVLPILRMFVIVISLIGILAHASALVSYFCFRSNIFGMNFLSHIVKATMTRIISYKEQNHYEGHMKVLAEGGGILAYLFLFYGAWKRSVGHCLLYVMYTALYLLGVCIHLGLLWKLSVLGVTAEKLMKEIVPAVLTATLGFIGMMGAILYMVVICVRGEEFHQRFDLIHIRLTGTPKKSSEIPTISGNVLPVQIQ